MNKHLQHKPLIQRKIAPEQFEKVGDQHFFIDFGKAAFGTIELHIPSIQTESTVVVHLGEELSAKNSLDREPEGSILYRKIELTLQPGIKDYRLSIPSEKRNTG